MNTCYLSLGSNQKSPERQLRMGMRSIKKLPSSYLVQASSLHWTKAWGFHQQDFCNAVVKIKTRLPPHQLLRACQEIEKRQGRVRKRRWGPRTLDIDIILYNHLIIKTADLTIPHPYFREREFVMKPLVEIHAKLK